MKSHSLLAKFIYVLTFLPCILFSSCTEDENKMLSVIGEASASLSAITELKSEFEAENQIAIETKGFPFEEAFEKANLDFVNQTGLYDIILQYNFSLSSFVRNDYVHSLDDLTKNIPDSLLEFESDLFQAAWEEVGYYYVDPNNPDSGIKKVGYPFASNTMLLIYNREMFEDEENLRSYKEEYGKDLEVPRTWDEYRNVAEFFTVPEQNQYGVCMTGADGGWLYYEWSSIVHGMGGQVMDKQRGWEGTENDPLLIDSDPVIEATKYFVDLKSFNKGAFFDLDMYKQSELIKEGNVAMALIWSDVVFSLIDQGDGTFDSRFGFAPVPGDKSMLAGGAFFINKKSEFPEEAAKFTVWLLQKENQIEMVKNGLCSPLRSVYGEPELQNIPYLKSLHESLERGVYMAEAGPDADLINQKVTTYVQKAWKGELTPSEAMGRAKGEINSERHKIFEAL